MSVSLNPLRADDLAAVRLPFRDGVQAGFALYLRAASALVSASGIGMSEPGKTWM